MRAQVSFRSRDPLTFDQMRSVAPSIFAAQPHDSRSERYTYVPTVAILERLISEGFQVFEAGQSRSRDLTRREFTKHMVKMRRAESGPRALGQETPEIVLINSHDGTSAYQMLAGMFRLVCLNGLMVPSGIVQDIRVPHTGDIAGRVIEGAFTVLESFDRVRDNADGMKRLTLSEGESNAFARAAIVAKYGEPEAGKATPITERQALASRRHDDNGRDLWSTFNRVQENLVRGGLSTRSTNGRRMRTREVQGISQNVQLNRALWTLADEMGKLKQAA